jgi:two-component system response regulator HydG
MSRAHLLIVDDDAAMVDVLATGLGRRGYDTTTTCDPKDAIAKLGERDFDVILTDLRMPGIDGIALCQRCLDLRPRTPVLVMTAFGSMDTAVAAMRAGAYDFIPKPVELDVVALAVERALGHRNLQQDVATLRERLDENERFRVLIGQSAAMQRVRDLMVRVADAEVPLLITGESGTGKEVVARALHGEGRRAEHPFVAVNCGALPEALLES